MCSQPFVKIYWPLTHGNNNDDKDDDDDDDADDDKVGYQ